MKENSNSQPNKIVLVNQDSGYLMVDIANSFYEKGYETSLVAGRVVERDIVLNPGIKVKKIKRYDRTTNVRRIFSWALGSVQILLILIFNFRDNQLLIVSNPPFAPLIPLFLRRRFSFLVFDVFPDSFVEYGIFRKNSIFVKLWSLANRKLFKRADHLFTLTAGMSYALSKYIDQDKINIIPLWTSNNYLKPIQKSRNPFIEEHGLQDKFIVLYSGNFGIAHQIDLILDLASAVANENVMFVLIGGGPSEAGLKKKLTNLGLKNCKILPWQDINVLPYSLASADLSIVTLGENATNLAIPSKVFNYMAVGSPVLCITGAGSDLERIVLDYAIGRSFTALQIEGMVQYINELTKDPELAELYHHNSLKASANHTMKNAELITQCYV